MHNNLQMAVPNAKRVIAGAFCWMLTVEYFVGLLIIAGIILTWSAWPRRRLATIGLVFVGIGGVGEIFAGFGSGDVNVALHATGALLRVSPGPSSNSQGTIRHFGRISETCRLCRLWRSSACIQTGFRAEVIFDL